MRLIEAVRTRNVERVRALLAERVNVNATQGDGATALHWAVHLDEAALVDTLIRAGARADVADDTGATPLYLACINRNGDAVSTTARRGCQRECRAPQRRNRADDVRTVRQRDRRTCAAGSRRNGQRKGNDAQPDRADVGGRPGAYAGRAGAARARRGRPRPLARVHANGHQRGDAARRTRGAELHRAARRHDGAALCGTVRRCRIGAAARGGRRRRERVLARWRQRAHRRRAQRPSAGGDRAPREGRQPECQRRRLHGAPCRRAQERRRAGEGAARTRCRSERADHEGHAGPTEQPGLRAAEDR